MTDPKWAQATENGRHYQDPQGGPLLPSVTNCIDHGSGLKTPGLIGWTAKVTTEYAWQALPLMVAAARKQDDCRPPRPDPGWQGCGRCYGCLTRELKNRRTIVRDTASDLGSRIHHYAEAHLTGKVLPPDPEVEPFVEQYIRFLSDFGVDIAQHIHSAEATVFNRRVGYAGTLDVLMLLALDGVTANKDGLPVVKPTEDGSRRLWLVDLKTSMTKPATATYPDQRLQLAGLRFAETLLLPDDTEIPMPKVVGCAVLNLRTKSYGFIPHVVGQAERVAFNNAVGMTGWATTCGKDPKPITPTGAAQRSVRAAAAPVVSPPPVHKPARARTQIRTRTRSVA